MLSTSVVVAAYDSVLKGEPCRQDVYGLHTYLSGAFGRIDRTAGGRETNFLFRQDSDCITVRSGIRPNWSRIIRDPSTTVAIAPSQLDYVAGEVLNFSLIANPTRQPRNRRCRVPIVQLDDQIDWLVSQGLRDGGVFSVYRDTVGVRSRMVQCERDRRVQSSVRSSADLHLTHWMASFDGVLVVEDPQRFRKMLLVGIGPAKGFGCGLLAVRPPPAAK